MFKTLLKITILALVLSGAALGQDLELASTYLKQAEYDKAAELYKKIATNKDQARQIHTDYLTVLYKIKDFSTAEKFLKSQIKNNPYVFTYKADYAQFYENTSRPDLAKTEFNNLIEQAAANDNMLYELQNFFFRTNRIELAADLLLKSRQKSNDPFKHDLNLSRVYQYLDKKELMLPELLNYGLRNNQIAYVQGIVQDNFTTETEIELFEKVLYDKINAFPQENFYPELLVWHFAQKQDFARAFIQARALDKRLNQEGNKVFELAAQAFQAKDFRNAAKMYQYLMQEYPSSELYPYVRRWFIQSKEETIKNTYPIESAQINEVIDQYKNLISELGPGPKTLDALRNKALLEAFYLAKHDTAIVTLENAIRVAQNNQKFKDQCKLDLGDIYILKNEPWEATLLYMQVEKSQKEEPLGEMAKLKNAKLQYYIGQFDLSKDILDILKKATTREISNDALQLSLLIQDNTGLDTSEVAMQEFANVDLLIFQNKYQEAIQSLSTLFIKYKTHSLADEILWLKANMHLKLNKKEEAIADLKSILENYKFDILADDALYTLANIIADTDKPAAMKLYRQMLADYPGSIYTAQSRIKYRELRGDNLN